MMLLGTSSMEVEGTTIELVARVDTQCSVCVLLWTRWAFKCIQKSLSLLQGGGAFGKAELGEGCAPFPVCLEKAVPAM
jgi:hypothetical protein